MNIRSVGLKLDVKRAQAENPKLSLAEGELYTFNSQSEHSVRNDSDEDRLTLRSH